MRPSTVLSDVTVGMGASTIDPTVDRERDSKQSPCRKITRRSDRPNQQPKIGPHQYPH